MKFARLPILMMILSSSFLYALEIEKLTTLSKQYYGANPEAYRKSMEQMKIPSIPGSDINDPLLRMAFYRHQSNEYLKSLGENAELCMTTLRGHCYWVLSVTVLNDGRLVSGGSCGIIKVWNLNKPEGKRCEATLTHDGGVNCLTILPDGRLVSGSDDLTLKVWDLSKPVMEQRVSTLGDHKGSVESVTVLSDGRLASGSGSGFDFDFGFGEGAINVWDLSQLKGDERTITGDEFPQSHQGPVHSVEQLHDGRLVSASFDKTIKVWSVNNVNNFDIVSDKRHSVGEEQLDKTPAGEKMPHSTPKCSIRYQETLTGHKGCVTSLLVLPDGRLVSGSYDKTIKIWDLSKPQGHRCVAILTGHSGEVLALTLLPDGRLVSGSADNTIKVWDLSKPEGERCVGTLVGHTSSVTSVTAMSDGRLVSGSWDRTIKVWNLSGTKEGG
ncbi:WD40 repeat domain-containing protein [Candidatus Sororendozoicomonas aggregata]|uniref:WD40 repeat domain-containing protein n=1 Tax=Candidatus Sororendozoicomonas aggregata TaxID=3073239 RepID=UPI002ED1AA9F